MRVSETKSKRQSKPRVTSKLLVPITFLIFLALEVPANADPLLLEAGMFTNSVFLVLTAGIGMEILALRIFINRPIIEIGAACLLANSITGFIGFVGLLYINMKGIPILPPGPLALLAVAVEIPLILWTLGNAKIPATNIKQKITLKRIVYIIKKVNVKISLLYF